jgi:cell division protein ZapA (FtsZ GTPase activity inhibitor)
MAEEATQTEQKTVVINGEEHNVADLSREQIGLLNQVVDLDGKIGQMSFNLAQAQAAKEFFMAQLTASFEAEAEPEIKAVSGGE